jgi:phage gp16-like protein
VDLGQRGLDKVLAHLRRAGFKGKPGPGNHPGRPHNIGSPQRGPLLKKVEALLADASRPWAYADGMAKTMFGIEKVALCDEHQLHRLVAALMYDQKRRAQKGTR